MLTPWIGSYDQPRQHIKKQRHYFVNKGPSSQGYGFSSGHVWMWELDYKESWAPNNWCVRTVVLEKTLESPLNFKEIQPVHPKEISPEYLLEGLMLKLKLQYFGHLMWRTDRKRPWCWEGLKVEGEGDDRGWDDWMALLTQWTWVWVNSRSWWWTGRAGVLQFMGSQGVGHDWEIELNSNAVTFLYFISVYKSTLYHRLQNPMQSFPFLVSELTLYHSPPSLIVSLIYILTIL